MKVALIDDHELVRDGMKSLLESRNATARIDVVYCGSDPQGALACAPEVALLDVNLGSQMPTVADTATRFLAHDIATLMISAYDDKRAVRSGIAAGALGFVPKSVSFGTLAEALATVARGELYLTTDLASILATADTVPDLSPRELDALRLYASGLKLTSVAHRMGISPHTAKEYLDRVRDKYALHGRQARTRTELYVAASNDGLMDNVE